MLRERLQVASDHVTPEQNLAMVSALAHEFPHSIAALESEHDLIGFTCVMHALGFTGSAEYAQVASLPHVNVFAGAGFVEWLLGKGLLDEVTLDEAEIGALVMYVSVDGAFRHIGLLRDGGRVESKWGQLGLFEHALWEVPSSYGDGVRYYQAATYETTIEWFYDYVAEQGVEFGDGA